MLGLVPNELWEYSVGDALRNLWRSSHGSDSLEIPGLGESIAVRSARAGIVVALQALGLPQGARIGVPLYCCPVVFKAIVTAGCTPCFIDIERDTFCMSSADLATRRSQVDAVIAVHMFGNVCDVPRLQEVIGGKPIIEDCAQSLGSKLGGRAAGSFGAISVFSFRSGKYLSVGEGGALFSRDAGLRSRLQQAVAAMPVPGRKESRLHVAKTYVRTKLRSRPLYGLVGYRLWRAYNKRVNYSSKSPLVLGRIYQSDLATTLKRLPALESAIQRQRTNANAYARALKLGAGMLCDEPAGAFYNRYQYPIVFPSSEQRDRMACHLLAHGVGTAKPYSDIASVARAHYGYSGDCPVAERVAETVLAIPNHHQLRQQEIARIAQAVNEGWSVNARCPGEVPDCVSA
jgi:perosamine synthetase